MNSEKMNHDQELHSVLTPAKAKLMLVRPKIEVRNYLTAQVSTIETPTNEIPLAQS
jgi:hypothetical protein